MLSQRCLRILKICLYLVLLLLQNGSFVSPQQLNDTSSGKSIVNVPTGITTVLVGETITQHIDCTLLPNTTIEISFRVIDGKEHNVSELIDPTSIFFENLDTVQVVRSQNFTLFGIHDGRFYLEYTLKGKDADKYFLNAQSSVVLVIEESEGWQGIWYELAFNSIIFLLGICFFVWRRFHKVNLPIWKGHEEGLFERVNYDDLNEQIFTKKYNEIMGINAKKRFQKFLQLPCDGSFVCTMCGVPAALNLRFHLDAGHLFGLLSIFAIGIMLPVNYLSGNRKTTPRNSFQQTTFSNVPLESEWYWSHVVYCYLVAFAVMFFLYRQILISALLRKRTKRIIGGRSLLIHHGLPSNMTSNKLHIILNELFPSGRIEEVRVIYDLTKLHQVLEMRREIVEQMERTKEIEARYETGRLSPNLLWLPGSVLVPSLTEMFWSYLYCKPFRYVFRHQMNCSSCGCGCGCRRGAAAATAVAAGSSRKKEYISVGEQSPHLSSTKYELYEDEPLDYFPEDALEVYEKRKCNGAAFVIFDTTTTRNEFVRFVRSQNCYGRIQNAIEKTAEKIRTHGSNSKHSNHHQNYESFELRLHKSRIKQELAPYLSKLVLESAPEPDDILWQNIQYHRLSCMGLLGMTTRQVLTFALLLLFSTPTAVLMYIKLDSTSEIYRKLYAEHSFLIKLIATYLPSLLLIAVNWLLLTVLYNVALFEPAFSETKRIKSFMIKGFAYLVMSSVFLPCIGVTAVYLAFSDFDPSGKSYVETFLYKVSGTFFISYVCQRTFLGSIVELTRAGERLAYQPWILSRSVTIQEKKNAMKPLPYYFGHDYALILSVFLVMLLGTVITPIITPFGALYFYIKFYVTKYNLVYVAPYTPGRGHLAQTGYRIAFVCLVLFEFTMAFVFLQVAGRAQFIAMMVLCGLTGVFYFYYIAGSGAAIKKSLSEMRHGQKGYYSPSSPPPRTRTRSRSSSSGSSPPSSSGTKRTILSPQPENMEDDLALMDTYTDPYKVSLSLFKLMGVNQFHRMTSTRTQVRYAFYRMKRKAEKHREMYGNNGSIVIV